MSWTKAAVATGLLLLALGFWWGTAPTSATAHGHSQSCGTAFPSAWLVPGTASSDRGPTTAYEEQVEAACDAVEQRARARAWTSIGLGAVVGLGVFAARGSDVRPAAATRR